MKFRFIIKNGLNEVKKSLSVAFGLTLSKPLEVAIQPTKRCNAKCLMCDHWHEKEDYISPEEIIDTLKQLKSWLGKGFFVQIAGGEPLIYKGIFDIFSYCADNGIVCKISTNGIALSDNVCDKIIASGLPYLSVSVDSHIPEIHNKFRAIDGTFDKAVHGLKYLSEHSDMALGVSSVLLSDNIKTFPETIDYLLSLPIHRILVQPVLPYMVNLPPARWNEYEYWVNDEEALDRLIDYMLEKKKADSRILNTEQDIKEWKEYFMNPSKIANNAKKKCTIGYNKLDIDYKGNISLGCGEFGYIGNIKTDSIKKVWKSPKAKKIRKAMSRCSFPCALNCHKSLSLTQKIKKAFVLMRSGVFNN